MFLMEGLDFWKLHDAFSVIQAAFLILGEDPSEYLGGKKVPRGFVEVKSALTNAIRSGGLKADIYEKMTENSWMSFDPNDPERIIIPDWNMTLVKRKDLVEWLRERNFRPAFFFDQQISYETLPGYLDKNHPRYPPKLAASVRVWEAVANDPKYENNGKTPKANISDWLTAHAAEFGLVKEDGEPNWDAINNQIPKIVNWKPDGGAPKTPGGEE